MNEYITTALNMIDDSYMRKLTKRMIEKAPIYIRDMALSEKKPYLLLEEDAQPGGLWLHSAKTAMIACRIFNRLGCDRDVGVIAGLLHHVSERGYVDEGDTALGAFDKLMYNVTHFETRGYAGIEFSLKKDTPESKCFFTKWLLASSCIRNQEGSSGKRWQVLLDASKDMSHIQTELVAFVSADIAARACLWDNLLIT